MSQCSRPEPDPSGRDAAGSCSNPGSSSTCTIAVMKKRGPADFPGRLTGEVILHIDHYDLNERAERHRQDKEAVVRRPWWRLWGRRPSAS
jgi:hypothetical protein